MNGVRGVGKIWGQPGFAQNNDVLEKKKRKIFVDLVYLFGDMDYRRSLVY